MKKSIILAVAVAGAFTFAASVRAGDAVMSPKAREQADSHRTVSGTTPDLIDRSVHSASPKQWEFATSLHRTASQSSSVDLAHAPRPNLPAKDPGYDVAWRDSALNQANVQIAPLK